MPTLSNTIVTWLCKLKINSMYHDFHYQLYSISTGLINTVRFAAFIQTFTTFTDHTNTWQYQGIPITCIKLSNQSIKLYIDNDITIAKIAQGLLSECSLPLYSSPITKDKAFTTLPDIMLCLAIYPYFFLSFTLADSIHDYCHKYCKHCHILLHQFNLLQ